MSCHAVVMTGRGIQAESARNRRGMGRGETPFGFAELEAHPMQYTSFGRTGQEVSILGFGGMRFDMDRPERENLALIRHALDKGITYFDTAPKYCGGKSEILFGKALRPHRDKVVLSTKGMPTEYDTAKKAVAAVKASLKAMRTDVIDFYHVWCILRMEHYDLAMRPGGQYEGLLRCQEDGLIRHILFSTHQQGPDIRRLIEDGHFAGVLLGMNILNFPYRWDGLLAAREQGVGTIAMNPLAGGTIPRHADRLRMLCTRPGETPTRAALRFALACPQIDITLNGFSTPAHIDEACEIADTAVPLTDADIDTLRARLGSEMNAICTGCGYCEGCPVSIPVPAYMQVYNARQMFDTPPSAMREELESHRKWGLLAGGGAEASACIQCGYCQTRCTQHLPILDRLRTLAAWETPSGGDVGS